MAILERLIRTHVDFDSTNSEHRKAYLMLNYMGRQHPTLRFVLKLPHTNVLSMMRDEMSKLLCKEEIMKFDVNTEFIPDHSSFPEREYINKELEAYLNQNQTIVFKGILEDTQCFDCT